jgi:hypothetical protein
LLGSDGKPVRIFQLDNLGRIIRYEQPSRPSKPRCWKGEDEKIEVPTTRVTPDAWREVLLTEVNLFLDTWDMDE